MRPARCGEWRVCLWAARRIGELVPETERGGKPDRGSNVQTSDVGLPRQRLSEFRKLAEIPLTKFKEPIEAQLSDRRERKELPSEHLRQFAGSK